MRTKRSVRYAAVVALTLSLLLVGVAAAQFSPAQLPGAGWWTGIQLQNVGSSTATVSIQAYPRTGTAPAPYNIEGGIPAGGQTTLNPIQLGLPAGFEGSAVVNSDQPLNAVTNVTNRYSSGGALGTEQGRAAGQYQGVAGTVASTELNFPLVKNALFGKSTTFYIQNAGTGDATVNATYRTAGGNFNQNGITIPEGRMVVLLPGDAGVPAGNGSLGSLTVTSTSGQALAGVSLEYNPDEATATIVQATRGLTPADRDAKAYAPIIKNTFGDRFTGLQIQNSGDAPVDVTVRYVGSSAGGSTCGGTPITPDTVEDLAPGASHTFVQLPDAAADRRSNVPANCLASATIEATGGSIVAIVNEAFVRALVGEGQPHRYDAAVTSFAIPATQATTRLSVPLYKENAFSKTTGLQVQNVGGEAANNVVATFSCGGGGGTTAQTYTTSAKTIPAGGSYTFVTLFNDDDSEFNGQPVPEDISGFAGICSAIVTSGQPIVGVANESSYPFFDFPETEDNLEQDKNNYEAFNLAGTP